MPDSLAHDRSLPGDWSAAFAGLPLECPPADGWRRVARQLDARAPQHRAARRERRLTWLIGTASAAVLAIAAWSPLSRWGQADTSPHPRTIASDGVPGTRGPAAPVAAPAQGHPTSPAAAVQSAVPDDLAAQAYANDARASRPAEMRHAKTGRSKRPAASAADASPARATREPGRVEREVASTASGPAPVAMDAAAERIRHLQARSAQLEALVALVRDDRVGSAGGALLTAELDARIAAVDGALSQPGMDAGRKAALWQQRIDLMQQLAGVESTARWLAAQGSLYDAALVSVY